ncbi:MAG: hypothetical protein ASARMPREDX12_009328 [Alectoria sarmentosa]|nr:MAG: hypothetical protein ASARMPREDX12_009328 [Alectoria sarmentosa]
MADSLKIDPVVERLENITPAIQDILKISGTAGVSIGVLHQQEILIASGFGYSDIQAREEADSDTLYYIASLTQSITASGIALLVNDGKLQWYKAISDLLPKFQHQSPLIRNDTTIEDILSHRTGLEQKVSLWMREYSWPQVTKSSFTKTAAYLEPVHQLRSEFLENNWTYGLIAQVVKKISGQVFSEFVGQNIFKPLKMERTWLAGSRPFPFDVNNFAEAYMYNGDSPYRVHKPPVETSSEHEATVGVKSSVNDLIRYYAALLHATKEENRSSGTHERSPPLSRARELLRPHTPMRRLLPSFGKTEYTLGWAQVTLPSALGALSGNAELVEKMPRIGEGLVNAPLILYQSGSMVGYQSSAILIPNTNSAIVVLSNTLANQHAADWIAQAVLEALLDVPHPTDFVALAREAAAENAMLFSYMHQVLVAKRVLGTTCRGFDSYVGVYENTIKTFTIEVFSSEAGLGLSFNGRHDEYELKHYHFDTFSFEMDYDDFLKKEMRPVTHWRYFLLEFRESTASAKGTMGTVVWRPDRMVEQGETFIKRTAAEGVTETLGSR